MQKAKTFVSQRISTTHKVLIWRPSRKKTHGHNVAPKHARSRSVGGCSARIRLTGLVSAWQRWRCCRPLARWASGQRHFLEVTVLGGILVVGDIRRHLADPRQCRVEYGLILQPENLRSADNGLGITRPDLQNNPHNLPPRNCQATNQASASTDAVQLLLQSGRVTEDAVLPPFHSAAPPHQCWKSRNNMAALGHLRSDVACPCCLPAQWLYLSLSVLKSKQLRGKRLWAVHASFFQRHKTNDVNARPCDVFLSN